jgi:hypothetical protein
MPNKPNAKNKDDLKVIITAIAFTLTLAFWNFFSASAQKPVQATNFQTAATLEPRVPQVAQVKILLGGPAPKTTIFVSQPSVARSRSQKPAPRPVTRTASSK